MTKPTFEQKNRGYSKKLVAWAIAGIYFLAAYTQSADLIYAVGAVVTSLILIYIANGQLDLRALLRTGIIDLRKKLP